MYVHLRQLIEQLFTLHEFSQNTVVNTKQSFCLPNYVFGIPKVCDHVVVNCGLCVQLSCKELCAYVYIQNKVVFGICLINLLVSANTTTTALWLIERFAKQRSFGKHNHNTVVVNRNVCNTRKALLCARLV